MSRKFSFSLLQTSKRKSFQSWCLLFSRKVQVSVRRYWYVQEYFKTIVQTHKPLNLDGTFENDISMLLFVANIRFEWNKRFIWQTECYAGEAEAKASKLYKRHTYLFFIDSTFVRLSNYLSPRLTSSNTNYALKTRVVDKNSEILLTDKVLY